MPEKYKTIDDYIGSFPERTQKRLNALRSLLLKIVPNPEEGFSYGVPAIKVNDKHLLCYAAFKDHIGLYPTPTPIKHFEKELEEYETSEGTIKFPIERDLPVELIKKVVKFRLKEF